MKLSRSSGTSRGHQHKSNPSAAPAPIQGLPAAETSARKQGASLGFVRSPRFRVWLLGALLVGAIVLAYQQAWHAGFIWDDDHYVTRNPLLTAPNGLWLIWFSLQSPSQYFPLAYTMFRFERELWGLNPAGYHWVSILLQGANALLLWRLLKRLSIPGAWLAAALFALHPVQVESVAWISEGKSLLSLFFSLLAMLAWVEFALAERKAPWRFYVLALILYQLALFSKTTACTLPAAMVLVLWWKHKPIGWKQLAHVVPFLLLGVGMGLVSVWWERYHQGLAQHPFHIGALQRILIASHAVWFYAGKLLWPSQLCFSYPLWTIQPSHPLAYGWLLAGLGLAALVYFARRWTGRSVEVALLFYVAMLSPLLGFFMLSTFQYSFVADHYQYVACIGPLTLVAAAITKGLERFGKELPLLKPAFCGALLLVLATLTWRQCGMYKSPETLWRTTIRRNPGSFMAQNNLGNLLYAQGRVSEAIAHYQQALRIKPDSALIALNLGNALFAEGRVGEAIHYYRKAQELQPHGASIAFKLGNALFAERRVDEAIAAYRQALKDQPDSPVVLCSLGEALLNKGNVNGAMDSYRKALQADPHLARARSGLGDAAVRQRRIADAISQYEAALKIQPDSLAALANLSWILATCPDPSLRDAPQALELAREAARLTRNKSPEILRTLSAAYANAGQFDQATAVAERALQLSSVKANPAFAGLLRAQIKSYAAHQPIRDASLARRTRSR